MGTASLRSPIFLFPFLVLLLADVAATSSETTTHPTTSGITARAAVYPVLAPETCTGSVAECQEEAAEAMMDSETNRRILQGGGKYLSYRGIYDPHHPAGTARSGYPYTRGCEEIYRCRVNTG